MNELKNENSKYKNMNVTKEHIIDAARDVFMKKGYEYASVREIAKVANVTTGAIYYYFKNKDELLYEVMNQSIHFIHSLSGKEYLKSESNKVVLEEVKNEVRSRMSKIDEQRLHILLLAETISKDRGLKLRYKENYKEIISKVADMFNYTFGIENEKYKNSVAAIFVAALDGFAIQYSLGVMDPNDKFIVENFNEFFTQCISDFLKNNI